MICSISARKCCSNWLDRLRSNKGFPTGDNLDLDHFLKNNDDDNSKSNLEPNLSDSNPSENLRVQNRKVAVEISGENRDDKVEWFGIMNDVLSDLFNMGEPNQGCKLSGKKSSRKQTNPKFCLVSTSSAMEEQSSGCERKEENTQAENEVKEEENVNNVDCGDNEEGETGELLGYSRNEVTVIDTSCSDWKFEKLVYRKRNVWKVREKKGKSRIIGRKKRKGNGSEGNFGSKKKLKISSEEDCIVSSKHSYQDEKGKEAGKDAFENPNQVPKKRFLLSRLSKKTKNGGKSAILIKGMSTNKKSGAKSPNSGSPNIGIEKQAACNKALPTSLRMGKGFQD